MLLTFLDLTPCSVSPAVSSLSSRLFSLFSSKWCWSPFLLLLSSHPAPGRMFTNPSLKLLGAGAPQSSVLAHTFSEWLHRHSCYLYTNGTQTCISSPHVLQTVIMEKKNTDTHIFISLLGITPVFKRHLELQKSKSIIGFSPSSLKKKVSLAPPLPV